MKLKSLSLILITCFLAHGLILPAAAADKQPNLVLQITVDQLRGNLVTTRVDKAVKGFDNLKVDDIVHARYTEAMATKMRRLFWYTIPGAAERFITSRPR